LNVKIVNFVKILGIINQVSEPSLVSRHTRISIYKALSRPALCYVSAELHKISACVQCTVQVCRLAVSNLHPPPYRSRQIICLSHSESVRLPLRNSNSKSGPPLTSYMLGRAILSLAHVQAQQHTLSHTVLCTACAPLC
jgi:hypothetical protein